MTDTRLPLIEPVPAAQRVAPLKGIPAHALRIHEIYSSVQGESTFQGRPCVFIRTTGCHLRCSWCDTPHAFYDGTVMSVDEIVTKVHDSGLRLVELTGGEPLLQPAATMLLTRLCDAGHTVLLETSGGVSTRGVDARVHTILDVKTPSSGEDERNVWANLETLQRHDEVKFCIASELDYRFSVEVMQRHRLWEKCTVLFSPVTPGVAPADLADWVVADRLPVRFQVQLHKVLWGDRAGV